MPDSGCLTPNLKKSSLVEFVGDARSFAGVTEGCCVDRSWRGRAGEGDPVALGSSWSPAGHTKAGIVGKIHLDMAITTEQLYILRITIRTRDNTYIFT